MKIRFLLVVVAACLLTVNAQARKYDKLKIPETSSTTVKPCFDHKTGECLICKGTGKIKNPKYSKKRFSEKEYIKCRGCKGLGKKEGFTEKKLDKNSIDPKKYIVNITCKKCKKNFTYKLKKRTITKRKRISFGARCIHCKKMNICRMDNPLYSP